MRAVLTWGLMSLNLDIHSVQYSKLTKTTCHCFEDNIQGCNDSQLMVIVGYVSKAECGFLPLNVVFIALI